MYVIDSNGDLVGFSEWHADPYYSPLIGCYQEGRLVGWAACDLSPQKGTLRGPDQPCWFRMPVPAQVRECLANGDPTVRVLRCEDAIPLVLANAVAPRPLHNVEDFLTTASRVTVELSGFRAFLRAPSAHQLETLFLEYLGRSPDPGAREHYLDKLHSGLPPLGLRAELLRSDEFRNRQVRVSDRLGALITSPIWKLLDGAEPLGEERPSSTTVDLSTFAEASDRDFVITLRDLCFATDDDFDVDAAEQLCLRETRQVVARDMVRQAAVKGVYVHAHGI